MKGRTYWIVETSRIYLKMQGRENNMDWQGQKIIIVFLTDTFKYISLVNVMNVKNSFNITGQYQITRSKHWKLPGLLLNV